MQASHPPGDRRVVCGSLPIFCLDPAAAARSALVIASSVSSLFLSLFLSFIYCKSAPGNGTAHDDKMLPLVFAASLFTAAAAADTAASPARPIAARDTLDGVIRAPVNAIAGAPPSLRARQNSVDVANQKGGTRYAVNIKVGTPAQSLTLILDTGSPDTWVNPSCATANVPSDCRSFPQFDPKKSSSLKTTNAEELLVYGIGNATVQYVRETVTIGCAYASLLSLDNAR